MSAWTIDLLMKRHHRTDFDCGQAALNSFLREYARQNQDENIGRTYVATRPSDPRVLGFFTLTVASVHRDDLSSADARRLPRYPVPVARLGRLAVDKSAQGLGLGRGLLLRAMSVSMRVADIIGVFALEAHAKDDEARRFYEHHGFQRLKDEELHLYLSMKQIKKAMG